MKLFASIFLAIGLLFALIGLGWLYTYLNSPDNNGLTEEITGPLVFTLFGLIFASIGGGVFYSQARLKAKRELLMRTGQKLRAVISNQYYNTSIAINKRHPLVVECVAALGGRKQTFKSHNIWNPVQLEIGQEITVYVDTRNDNSYWVEVGE
jgi:hypothetical protein